jgi:hypothetical protein
MHRFDFFIHRGKKYGHSIQASIHPSMLLACKHAARCISVTDDQKQQVTDILSQYDPEN